MIGPAPKKEKHSWDGKEKLKFVLKSRHPVLSKHDKGYPIYCLPESCSEEEKMDFEKGHRKNKKFLKQYSLPDIEDPYYTWEGKIVERASLAGRELPLVD